MVEESKQVARWLEERGVVALNVSADYFQSSLRMPWKVEGESLPRPPSAHPHGFLIPLISQIKQVVDIPVMGVGWLDLETGERALWEGKIDMAVIGRPLLADPEIPDKATSGRLDDIRPCIGCLMCQTNIDDGVFCTVNASVGRNYDYPITPAKGKKRVIVVGGGPSGLEAARVAALRGHEVVLYEKSEGPGGQLLIASLPPHKEILAELVNYLTTQAYKLGVKVELGIEATPELILGTEPDVVIVATGIALCALDIPGVGRDEVVDFKDVLTGRKDTGDAVVIIGGGVTGCETAEFLAYKNKRVTIVEMLEDVATGMEPRHKQYLMERLDALGVTVLKKTRAKAVQEDGLAVTMEDGKERVLTAETIVLATGSRPNQELYRQLVGKVPEIYQAGDCAEPRRIFEAIADGFLISQAI
jgi:NADPH-dependent 2,4-dienoyl-CoA reductase/sulfur reductase-like enzyme